jgi:multidrug efflux pump
MAKFFIDRPIFAWVIALFIIVVGAVSITQLPIAQYPPVAPPAIVVNVAYPGASAQTLEDSVLSVIEREMNGSPGLIYMESVAQADGTGTITITFETGTNAELAQVDVQNRLSRATPRLPAAVTQQGVRVDKSRNNFLLFTMLSSDNPAIDTTALGDYASRNVVPELQRVAGVGQAQLFGTERAMRIWIEPAKLQGYNLSAADVNAAIRAQNAQVSSGTIGDLPNVAGQAIAATVVVNGQLTSTSQFGDIVLRANTDGSSVRLKDVARIELGGQAYSTSARLNGEQAVGIGVQLAPGGNALQSAKAIRAKMAELERYFPQGVKWTIPYDSSRFVNISITEVVKTLFEAVALVFLVMFLFLQNWRYTLIPTVVVPIALLGTFGILLALGFSINVLTMFGMVLVIGIVVDDAIVVVENVERIMSEEGLSPLEATRKAMRQISGAIIGVTVVLISVFVPLAFFAGSTGNIYRQFSAVMGGLHRLLGFPGAVAHAGPVRHAAQARRGRPPPREEAASSAGSTVASPAPPRATRAWRGCASCKRAGAHAGPLRGHHRLPCSRGLHASLPTSFLPQGRPGLRCIVNVQLPPGATQERTLSVMQQVERLHPPAARSGEHGRGARLQLLGPGPERRPRLRDAQGLGPTARPEPFGRGGGRPRLRGAVGHPRRLHLPAVAAAHPRAGQRQRLQLPPAGPRRRRPRGADQRAQPAARHGQQERDPDAGAPGRPGRRAAAADRHRSRQGQRAGRAASKPSTARLSTALGSTYVNDFPNQRPPAARGGAGRRAGAHAARGPAAASTPAATKGEPVPLSAFATTRWVKGAHADGPLQRLPPRSASPALGGAGLQHRRRDGRDRAARRAAAARLRATSGPASRARRSSPARRRIILYAFAILAVFLCLAALYESWTIPLAVILVVPLGVLGVLLATLFRAYANDVYFQVALITIIGLSAKNAILIIEFAKDLQAQGKAWSSRRWPPPTCGSARSS